MQITKVYLESEIELMEKVADLFGLKHRREEVADIISYTNVEIDVPEEHEKEFTMLLALAAGLEKKL